MKYENPEATANQDFYAPRCGDIIDTMCGAGIVVSTKPYKDFERNEDVFLTSVVLDSGEIAHVFNLFIKDDSVYTLLGKCSTEKFIEAFLYYVSVMSRHTAR